ncbi:hypothetical protein HYPSUDRAFT_37788 [Hypholoma sublateritium FD-334 SS-4]|uniref:G-protein coupled receptors family 1 profile domain-containing protein n=1 Tax=Hypholoma sublateritium (strain FD-334 SS-4) TaxID=945553 RepID=A0A0D2P2Z9_HYPSF|nr:hypothetical protein HYPSUDRAFT_37788 [Hypholoma sublateritium FD-334 SS-4]
MSDPQFPVNVEQALIDSSVETTILQAFLTGLYTLLFVQAIVPLVREGRYKIYALALTLLYAMIVINLASAWDILRSVVVLSDATRDTMALQILGGPLKVPRLANASGSIAILIADSILAWRCYVYWQRNIFVLGGFSLLILGEVALIPTYLVLNATLGPHQISIICLYFLISVGITTIATSMIAYKIITLSRRRKEHIRRYEYTAQIIVESGLLYSVTLFITAVLLAVQGSSLDDLNVVQAASYFGAILTPVTGIAPTLTSYRILSTTAADDEQNSHLAVQSRIPFARGAQTTNGHELSTIKAADDKRTPSPEPRAGGYHV